MNLYRHVVKRLMKATFKLSFFSLFGCNTGYQEKEGRVTFNGEEVTSENFVVLNEAFAKDDSVAYYKKYSIPGADVSTFRALDEHYATDTHNVFYCDQERESQSYYLTKRSVIIKIDNAHPNSFTSLGEGYAKDNRCAYANGIGFAVRDVASLSVLEGKFLKDHHQVYYDRKPVKGAHVNSFRILNHHYAKDTARAYYYGYPGDLHAGIHAIPARARSFILLDYPYSADQTSVFYYYSKLNGADPVTFTVLGNGLSKDKEHVYLESKRLTGADPATFRPAPHDELTGREFPYALDRSRVFWKDKPLDGVDVQAFRVLGLDYATDGKRVYFRANPVKDADPATFQPYEHGLGDVDAMDAKPKYLQGIRVASD